MTTTAADTTRETARRFATTLRRAAVRDLAQTLEDDRDPWEAAKIWREEIKQAWAGALEDCGYPEDIRTAKTRFPL
jgi:NAD-dependent oxidoreductase involved in siderophore biosynthesis